MLVEFDCRQCGKHHQKHWHSSMPGKPTYCSNVCKSEWQRTQKPVRKEWLYQKYVVEKLNTSDIALIVKRDPKSVYNWLRDFGIPTRGRGTDPKSRRWYPGCKSAFAGHTHTEENKEKFRQARKVTPNLPHLTGGVHYLKGKRGAEVHSWKGGLTPERQKLYGTPEWGRVAQQVWRRDGGSCQRCGLTKKEAMEKVIDLDVHHIVGFEVEELRSVLSNLVLLCEPCHYWVHSKRNKDKEFLG